MNIGEEIVEAYLQYIKECEFIRQNLYTSDAQGEIDVVGIDIKNKKIYICEVAIHLTTGLMYVNKNITDTVNRLVKKFSKGIKYAEVHFRDYEKIIMLWSPIVKNSKSGSKSNQLKEVEEIKNIIKEKYGIDLIAIINEKFMECLRELREFAKKDTKENKSPVIRFMQVEEYLKKHLRKF
ncbi:MAG: hypothetical protein LBC85_08240 [Fibromonadaceae bacterium]|jgi:hypothetical protein|nr:hypothetical protein [Fibromonadaceae bacterium]